MSALSSEEILHASNQENASASTEENTILATEEQANGSWNVFGGLGSFSIRDWWISTSEEDLLKAERAFVDAFIDSTTLEVTIQNVPIYYDVTPIKLKQNQSKGTAKGRRWSSFKNCKPAITNASKLNVHPNGTHSSMNLRSINDNVDNANDVNALDVESILNDSDETNEKQEDNQVQENTEEQECNQHLHTVTFRMKNPTRQATEKKNRAPPIVLLHGYGCAGGIHIPAIHSIFDELSRKLGKEVMEAIDPEIHVVDWLGNGASSRPKFDQENFTVEDTENWFVDSLEEWRKKMDLEDLILAGHSLGGYMCSVYALRYPEKVAHLVLVSPVGFPKVPADLDLDEWLNGFDWKRRFALKTLRMLWNNGWTPHDAVRYAGPKGRDWLGKLVSRRLFRVSDDDPLKPVLSNYLYHVFSGSGSGEYALNKILQPGAWAWNPLVDRLPQLKMYQELRAKHRNEADANENLNSEGSNTEEKNSPDAVDANTPPGFTHHSRHPTLRIDAIFGQTDWMDPTPWHYFESHHLLEAKLHVLSDCGHQMILEQPQKFGKRIGKITSQCLRDFYHIYLATSESLEKNADSKKISETTMSTEDEVKSPEEVNENENSQDSSEETEYRGKKFGERG